MIGILKEEIDKPLKEIQQNTNSVRKPSAVENL